MKLDENGVVTNSDEVFTLNCAEFKSSPEWLVESECNNAWDGFILLLILATSFLCTCFIFSIICKWFVGLM